MVSHAEWLCPWCSAIACLPFSRTLEFLMRHLARLADYCSITNMHTKNLAIVWAPNLLRYASQRG